MYGRGGKRSLPPPAPPGQLQRGGVRLAGPSPARRTLGASPGGEAGGGGAEESYKMVSAEEMEFGAIIRLTPDLVEEIRRLEAQGCAARIKFDANSNDLSGNVIDVGGKEFRFTWSRELGVCDIYEELQNGEDGNGLLSECGSAWRKLNVQRILDESLKNHVKMRSEEAERKHKSRKSIVLDPANPSVKNQAKTLAAAALEGNMRRMHWKKDQFKKRKLDSVPSTIPPKPTFKSGTPSHISSGGRPSMSPQPSPSEHVGMTALLSSFGMATNLPKTEEHIFTSGVENMNLERETLSKSGHCSISRKPVASKGNVTSQPSDLRSLLISLLVANPKGMSIKALEKAVGETIPNSGKKIESIIKSIATYQAPGRYLLKPGIDSDVFRKPPSRTMSPDLRNTRISVSEERERESIQEAEHKTQLPDLAESDNENLDIEKIEENIDIEKCSPEAPAVNINPNEKEQGACTSSESGSDSESESDSSDSETDSQSQGQSRSKSKSQSSESESGESSGKEGSDVDVDIMTSDDEKGQTGKLPIISIHESVFGRDDDIIIKSSPSDHGYNSASINHLVAEDRERKPKDGRVKDPQVGPVLVARQEQPNMEKNSKDRNKRVSGPKHFQDRSGSSKRPRGSSPGNPRSQQLTPGGVDFLENPSDLKSSEGNAVNTGNTLFRARNQSEKLNDKMDKDIRDVIMDVNEKYSIADEENKFFSVEERENNQKGTKSAIPLRRELSELELGEFREPMTSSKVNVMDNFSSESKKGRERKAERREESKDSPYLSKCASQPGQQVNARRIQETESTAVSVVGHEGQKRENAKQNGFHGPTRDLADGKPNISYGLRVSSERSKESFHVETVTSSGQKVDFSSDEDESFYAKYDKAEPLLRGPIKDYSQYKEYTQEFHEKYDCYSSLNTHLEKYRNEFLKIGHDLETSKGRDREAYRAISEQIMQMYHQCRKKHGRMKKIFVLLHDELKALKQRIKEFADECSRN